MVAIKQKVNLWYVRGLRKKTERSEPHPKLVSLMNYLNDRYRNSEIPLEVELKDVGTYLNGLTSSELVSTVQRDGKRQELIDLIQTPISQAECRKRAGLEFRGGVWYLIDKETQVESELKPYKTNLEEAPEDFRFRKDFVSEMERKYQRKFQEIKDLAERIRGGDSKLIGWLSSRSNFIRGSIGANEILMVSQMSLNEYIELQFKKNGGVEKFRTLSDKFYMGEFGISGDGVVDQYALYINSVQEMGLRKKYFSLLKHMLIKDVFMTASGGIVRTNFSEAPDSDYGDYVCQPGFKDLSGFGRGFNHILRDKIQPFFFPKGVLLYEFVRSYYGKTGNPGYSSVLLGMEVPKIACLVLHELAHQTAGAEDSNSMHPELDSNLMNVPLFYEDASQEMLQSRMSVISLREAYRSLL